MENPLFIYIVTHPKFGDKKVKIGRSIDIKKRLSQYNIYCPEKAFSCYYSLKLSEDIIRTIEEHFFANVENSSGEWFNISPEAAKEIIHDIVTHPEIFQNDLNRIDKRGSVWRDYPVQINTAYKLRRIRLKLGKTQTEFANSIGVNRSQLGSYEEGRSKPKLALVLQIAKIYNIGITEGFINLINDSEESQMINIYSKYKSLKTKDRKVVDLILDIDSFI